MASSTTPRNRKERRAQAQLNQSPAPAPPDVVLSQPSRTAPSHKTLIDIAVERELLHRSAINIPTDSPSIITATIDQDGKLSGVPKSLNSKDPLPTPYLDVTLYTTTLVLLHFTLTLLVHHQYASDPPSIISIFLSSTIFSLAPWLLFLLVFILHPRSSLLASQVLFASMSMVAGCWLVYATNDEPYLAVMKKAPALGTLWIWAVVEMRWEWAVGCLGVVGGWGWWRGYTIL